MVKLNSGPHSFKLGVLSGICLFLFIECFVSLFTQPDFRVTRFLFMIIFGVVGIASTLMAYRKL